MKQAGLAGSLSPPPATAANVVVAGEGATPAMAQWFAAKAEHPDALIFFRMGDFYELFFNDAERAAAALDIQLTQRGSHAGRPINMCGVPVHAADAYLARLIRKGFRVAIAEQTEDPKARARNSKAPLRRAVVRLVTPGTLTEETLLEPGRRNLLLALATAPADRVGAGWLDISTGSFETEEIGREELPALLARVDPAEILCAADVPLGDWSELRSPFDDSQSESQCRESLAALAGPGGLDPLLSEPEIQAAGLALAYVRLTQVGALPTLAPPRSVGVVGRLAMDSATQGSLEITQGRDGARSLLSCIRLTLTASGARLLAERLASPLTSVGAIMARVDAWAWLVTHHIVLAELRRLLKQAPDMARALARLSVGRFTPRDLSTIKDGQLVASGMASLLRGALRDEGRLPDELHRLLGALELDPALGDVLQRALAAVVPARLEDGGLVAAGFDGELTALRALRDDSRAALAGLQLDLAQRYGVASLKIRHHQQLGYVMEVPAAAAERLRAYPDVTLRQSTANGARFINADLAGLDQRIAEATVLASDRERAIVQHLVTLILAESHCLRAAAAALAEIDVAQNGAGLAQTGLWCRPELTDGCDFVVEGGRHPVVEAAERGAPFIANDCDLSPTRRLCLLTGPNMAGKSTFLRQNALIVILAQAGLPVPAMTARIGIVDRLFCRVGAADDLARGRSTFMVEMIETAAILQQAGPRSLVIIDEIGRGTATLDGLAIAWAVLEALHNRNRSRTIFATHFHELARLRHEMPHLCPHTMRVKEWKGSVVFLHEVAEGAGGRSWGVHVARLAGVPQPVVRRAGTILAALETRGSELTQAAELPLFSDARSEPPACVPSREASVLERLAAIEPDVLTPKQALELLYELRQLGCPDRLDTVEPHPIVA